MGLEWRYFKQREEPVQSTKGGSGTAECVPGVRDPRAWKAGNEMTGGAQ